MQFKSTNGLCQGTITTLDDGCTMVVKGKVKVSNVKAVNYITSAPGDSRMAVFGTNLPFPNKEYAYSHTSNQGTVATGNGGSFEFTVIRPNPYYDNNGRTLVDPVLTIVANDQLFTIPIPARIPHKTLTSSMAIRSTGRNTIA